jgi:putative ABC transport system ATP-binding protein
MLCDEPTGALDSQTGLSVLEALFAINRDLGTVTALITHNAAIQKIAHRVLFVADGRITRILTNKTRAAPEDISW